jgi:hypothetical protein
MSRLPVNRVLDTATDVLLDFMPYDAILLLTHDPDKPCAVVCTNDSPCQRCLIERITATHVVKSMAHMIAAHAPQTPPTNARNSKVSIEGERASAWLMGAG